MADYGTWGHGSVAYPLTASLTNTLLHDADPAIDKALAYYSAVLNAYMGGRFVAAAAEQGYAFASAVQQTIPLEPSPFLASTEFRFPLLACWRSSETYAEWTSAFETDTATWELSYVLPPLPSARQTLALVPILRAVARIISRCTSMGADPNYNSGELVWAACGVQRARVLGVRYAGYEPIDTNNRFFRAVNIKLEMLERDFYPDGSFQDWDGADASVNFEAPDTTTISNVAQFSTHPAPSVTVATPNSGSRTGGTSVTLTGTNFRNVTSVMFGSVPAGNVVVASTTSLTCTAPAYLSAPTALVDVVVTNDDGLQGTLTAGFTFTAP